MRKIYLKTHIRILSRMRIFCLMMLAITLSNLSIQAQCTNITAFGTVTAPGPGVTATITTCLFGGEYTTINSATAATSYTVTGTGGTGNYITIRQGASGGPVIAFGLSPLTWTSTVAGTYYAHLNTDAACGSDFSCHEVTITNNTVASPGCTNTTAFGTVTAPGPGVTVTITTCLFGGEYTTINSATAATSYTVTGTGGTGNYITIRQGASGGPVIAFGFSPLTWTSTVAGTYYAHLNTDAACGSDFSCHTVTITNNAAADPCSSISTIACATPATTTLVGAGAWSPGNCGFSTPGNEKVYSFTPTVTGVHALQVTATNSAGFVDYFFKAASGGCGVTGWTCIQDIFSPTTASMGTLTAGVEYYILLDGESTASVTHTFQINCPAAGPCASISTIACATPATTTLVGAGAWSPGNCGFTTPGNEKMYSFTPTVTGVHSLQVTATNSAGFVDYFYKAASDGCSATGWTCIQDIFSPTTASMGSLTAGVEYYILLDAESTASVTHTFQINCPCPDATISYSGSPYCQNAGTANVTLTGSAGGTYSSTAGLNINAATGAVTLGTSTPGTYTVTYSIAAAGSCPLFTTTASITVNPTPNAIATPASQTICSGATITPIVLTSGVVGTTYTWTRDNTAGVTGIPGNGVGNISGTLTNITAVPITVTFTITPTANGCPGPTSTATVLVNPTPNAVATPSAQSICNASAITPIVLTNTTAGTTYAWTRDNNATVTGIAASGSGTPITGTLTNTTTAPVTVTFTITPTANGCPGPSTTATVIVQPTATVDQPVNQTVCTGTPTAAVNFTSPVAGVTYNWTNNTTSIGLAASGTGNIPSFIATNATLVPVTATITVTPIVTIDGGLCGVSAPQTFTNSTPVAIPTGPAVISSTVVVSGAPTYLYDVDILTSITHTFSSDLDITITSPAGTIVTLTTDNGGANDNVFNGTLWNDKANPSGQVPYTTNNGLATDNAYVNLTTATPLVSEEALGAFIGENPNGTWTITVSDDLAGDGGSLNSWSVIVSGLSAPPTLASASYNNTTPVVISTGAASVITSTINVSGAGTVLHDVDVTTFIKHTFAGDLDVTIQSPAGTVVTLTTDNGGGNDDVFNGTVWNDKANPGGQVPYVNNNGLATDHTYANLTLASPLAPEEALAAFIGENPNGTWTLTISDDAAGDGGSLDSWSLNLQTASCPIICTGPSKTFTITVNPLPTITCPANITTASDVGVCNKTVNYTPAVTGTPAPTLSYVLTGATTGSGAGSGSGLKFNVGVTTVTITATNICATVTCSFTITVTDSQLPVINTQPANRTVCAGSNATFTVVAVTAPSAGGPLSYQWQLWNGSTWNNIAGATAATLTLNSVTQTMNTNSYRVQVIGLCTTITSGFATLYVNPLPTINLTTSIPPALLPTQVLTITATTAPSGGSYVWFKNGVVIPGATGNTLAGLTVSDIGTYRVVYTNGNGCVVTSANIDITGQPSDNLYVYPVPNQGVFNVRFYNQANEQVTVRVFDAKGAEVYSRKVLTTIPYTTINVDLSTSRLLANGTYVVDVRGADGRLMGSRKIIVYNR